MKKFILFFPVLLFIICLKAQNLDIPTFGTDSTFEVLTWNIEWFPKQGQTTVNYVNEIVIDLDVDLLALQEIDDKAYFDQLMESLDEYDGYYVVSEYSNLAYLYKTDEVEVDTIYEIYTAQPYWRPFPRAPMVMELQFMDEEYVLINNHFKCCGDGILDTSDPWDEEKRRLDASYLLEQFIDSVFPSQRVILLGDLNDNLADEPQNNVFNVFFDDPDNYLFVDLPIAQGGSSGWSYPSWPSHLDHILITNEIFADFENENSTIETLKLDKYFPGGFYEYDQNVSDHRPVALKIKPEVYLNTEELSDLEESLINTPNPFHQKTTIRFKPAMEAGTIAIYNSAGQVVQSYVVSKNQSSVVWNAEKFPKGIFFVQMKSKTKTGAIRKMVLLK